MTIELRPGDIFCSQYPSELGSAIRWITGRRSQDRSAEYSHVGIITGEDGGTFEAVRRIQRQNLFKDYAGVKVRIGRHRDMTGEAFEKGMADALKFEGHIYPYHRLLLHAFHLSGIINTGKFPVCSELAMCHFIWPAGLIHYKPKGWNPDQVADMMYSWRWWNIFYEGAV